MRDQDERLLTLLYQLASYDGQLEAGMHLSSGDMARLHALRGHFEQDRYPRSRRLYRRYPLDLPGQLTYQGRRAAARLRELSGNGCLLETPQIIVPEDRVELRLGSLERSLYLFSGRVRRIQYLGRHSLVALELEGIPLLLRGFRSSTTSARSPGHNGNTIIPAAQHAMDALSAG